MSKETSLQSSAATDPRPGWETLDIGCCMVKAGSGADYQTGEWRSSRPIIDLDKCVHCLMCWVFCPDASIDVKNAKVQGIDLYHCKGCGICVTECPRKCISMVDEQTALRQEAKA